MTDEQTKEAPSVAANRGRGPSGSEPKYDAILQQMDDVASTAAEAAKDYRIWMLGHIKANIDAALDYADGIASVGLPQGAAEPAAHERERPLLASAKVAEQYRAKAFELMTANVKATLEYAQQLTHVKTPAEFIALATSHARKHSELIMAHTAALGTLSQSLTSETAERMSASIAKVLNRRTA